MKRKRHESASFDPNDAVHVVPAQRHATDLPATGQVHWRAAPPVGNPCSRVLPYDLDR